LTYLELTQDHCYFALQNTLWEEMTTM